MAINYSKIDWDTTKYVNPTNMNQMDNGIKNACDGVDDIVEIIGDTSTLPSPEDDLCTNISEVNSNLTTKVSFYTDTYDNLNLPSGYNGYYKVQRCYTSDNEWTEIAIGYFGSAAMGVVFQRSRVNGTTSNWVRLSPLRVDEYAHRGFFSNDSVGFVFMQTVSGDNIYRLQLADDGTLKLFTSTDRGGNWSSRNI